MKKTLLTIWATAIVIFGSTATYILVQEQNINAPGEIREVVSGAGLNIFIFLSLASLIAYAIFARKGA